MTHYDVLVLGPQGPGRVELEERLRRLGHTVAAADIEQGTDLPAADLYDAVVLDAREPDLRPGVETSRPNVARAGAWTDTGWPATMESAIRSGRRAAQHILSSTSARVTA